MTENIIKVPQLELQATIGFNGHIPNGLHIHPDRLHFVYPLGNTVVIENIQSGKQSFLAGHTNYVTCIVIGNNGNLVASGQITHMGFKADIIVWNYKSRDIFCQFTLHKVKVQDLAFSPNDKYLLSLGGSDDGCVVVWGIESKAPICGSPAQKKSSGNTICIAYGHQNELLFATAGENTLRLWELDVSNRKVWPTDIAVGKVKRTYTCIQITCDDCFFYCGTTTGDIIGVNIETKMINFIGPEKEKFPCGIGVIRLLKTGEIIVGGRDGRVEVVKGEKFKRVAGKRQDLGGGAVTSVALRGDGHQFFVGTSMSEIYKFSYADFKGDLLITCHPTPAYDIAFPCGCSDIFVTCGKESARVWSIKSNKEILRIYLANKTCRAVNILRDGKAILTGWDDGKIRAYYPSSGKFMFEIKDAHCKGVTALASTTSCSTVISGGGEGYVRIWRIEQTVTTVNKKCFITTMQVSLSEHKGAVSVIKVKHDDAECISASTDGTCIIWDIVRYIRKQILFANTLFRAVCYHPDEMQVLTTGTDLKIGYWEASDGSVIRELDACHYGSTNALDIDDNGNLFATGGEDKLVRVWKYNEGEVTHIGLGHSATINCIRICPNNKYIISVSEDGAVLRWTYPDPSPALVQQNRKDCYSTSHEAEGQLKDLQISENKTQVNANANNRMEEDNKKEEDTNADKTENICDALERIDAINNDIDNIVSNQEHNN